MSYDEEYAKLKLRVEKDVETIHKEIVDLDDKALSLWENEKHIVPKNVIQGLVSTIIFNQGKLVIDKVIISPCPVFEKDKDKLNDVMLTTDTKDTFDMLLLTSKQEDITTLLDTNGDLLNTTKHLDINKIDAFVEQDFDSTVTLNVPIKTVETFTLGCPSVFDIACPKINTQLEEIYVKIELNHHKINMMHAQATMLNRYMAMCIDGLKDDESETKFMSSIHYSAYKIVPPPDPVQTLLSKLDIFASDSRFYLDILKQNGRSL